jgi:hypothetical protein
VGEIRFPLVAFCFCVAILASFATALACSIVSIFCQSFVAALSPTGRWVKAKRVGLRHSPLPARPYSVTRIKPKASASRMAGAMPFQ